MDEQKFKALPLDQRKAHQERLRDLGLYVGKIDGNFGEGTKGAFASEAKQKSDAENKAATRAAQERSDALEAKKLDLKDQELKQKGKTEDVDNATKTAKALRRQRYSDDASSGLGMATQSGASIAAPALAGWAGLRFGDKVNQQMDRGQEKRNVTLRGAADDRVRGLTTRDGAVTGTKLAGAMPSKNPLVRVLGRMAPHIGLAALSGYKGAELLGDVDEEQPFYSRMADRGAGLAYLGFGGSILKRGIQQAAGPGVSPDAQALSVINSNQLRRNNQPPEDTGPKLTPRQTLVAEAKTAGITGTGKMNMTQLGAALRKIGPKTPLIGPAVAGALAYGMTPDDARADGSGGGRSTALTNAGVATGIGAGAGYGLDRLAKAIGNVGRGVVGRALGPALNVAGAGMAAYDQASEARGYRDALPPDQRDGAAGMLSHAMPLAMRGASDIASISSAMTPGNATPQDYQGSVYPEGIPLPQPDGAPQDDGLAQIEQLAAQDPELASMIRELIMARVGAQ
jgi:hypothetical protein